MVAKILPFFPEHHIYVEPFGGGASLLMAKEPSAVEVYNDLDEGLVNLFRVLRDVRKFKRFIHRCIFTPYARMEWKNARETWADCKDDVEKAYRWFVMTRMSFAGLQHSWGRSITTSHRGMGEAPSSWISIIDMLPEIHRRLMRVQVECKDAKHILKDYDTPETLFYCDPPYIPETRREGRYQHEMSMADHQELVEVLLNLRGRVILSGYAHPVYEPLERAGWERKDWETYCIVNGRTKATKGLDKEQFKRKESVWIKY